MPNSVNTAGEDGRCITSPRMASPSAPIASPSAPGSAGTGTPKPQNPVLIVIYMNVNINFELKWRRN